MTQAAVTTGERGRFETGWFALSVFVSASLLFVVQPMVTKLLLPLLGGSPSVWNTAMVFFQAALLAGYAYAHALQRLSSLRSQMLVHGVLLLLAALFLPLHVTGLLGEPDPARPIVWTLGVLVLSIGAPFAVLSSTAPLIQAWFARVRTGEDPYPLYAASNLGSFVALLSYPILIEPLLGLTAQRWSWTVGYGVFVLVLAALAMIILRRSQPVAEAADEPATRSPSISWRERLIWVALAFIPSSLMLGVTLHLSTDVASAPFLWVAPLALYLLTFVIAFQAKPWIPYPITLIFQAAAAGACIAILPFRTAEWALLFGIHLVAFFFTALMCHQGLALRRPAPDRLTEFYLWISVGGVLGGIFNALLAPVIFDVVREYPLVLVLAALARPWQWGKPSWREIFLVVTGLLACLVPPFLMDYLTANPEVLSDFSTDDALVATRLLLGLAAICAFLVREQTFAFLALLIAISFSGHAAAEQTRFVENQRSFFGVLRIGVLNEPRMGGEMRMLLHGTTLHGAQAVDPSYQCNPTLYYARVTPLGEAVTRIQARSPSASIGVVGQGTGVMAAYKRAADDFTYYEIDPLVDRMARDPSRFTYISDCAEGPIQTVLGDARLSLRREPDGRFDLLVVDAFSSDSIPTHLLTEEAIREYLRVVKPNGVVVLHLSNRNLEIVQPALAAGRALGVPTRYKLYIEPQGMPALSQASTEALILSPTEAGLEDFTFQDNWTERSPERVRPWTDDYVNLFGALLRSWRIEWESRRRD
ncbi:fused MFS/spermidine synthase [Brevundimonas sp. 2R-24]|uniref:Fused MFS/spermidine synthase n=1 Tax=Peiella sedimenti TaxID=3061083 RepID=A0ABT8SN49_9CAUL|nr:fused MFS/spermidine synthase [Caulobacteraceae bacterium XZ-24]